MGCCVSGSAVADWDWVSRGVSIMAMRAANMRRNPAVEIMMVFRMSSVTSGPTRFCQFGGSTLIY